MKKIGIVGAGIMAAGMASNFLKHDYIVYAWNRSPERLQPLVDAGVIACPTPKAVAKAADIVIECVSDDEASRRVWLEDDGILAGVEAGDGKVLITSSTLSLAWTDELTALCTSRELQFLDMPLTGSRVGAEGGTLKLLVGGQAGTLDSIRSDLEAIADKVYLFGPAGSGMRFKLILNSLIGIHMNATAQAVGLARKAGIDPDAFGYALFDAPMGPASPAANLLLQGMGKGPEHLNFAVKWLEKDLRYAQDMAKKYGAEFTLLNDTQADYAKAKSKGLAERDISAIAGMYE